MSLQTMNSPTEDEHENHFTVRDKKMDETPEQYDIFQQLAKKDRDLELAAELGKVLLQENEELKLRLEQLTHDYLQKLEVNVQCVIDVLLWLFRGILVELMLSLSLCLSPCVTVSHGLSVSGLHLCYLVCLSVCLCFSVCLLFMCILVKCTYIQ